MKKILWFLLKIADNNWGYSTPIQERFSIGDICKISQNKTKETNFEIGEEVSIVEFGRHDYLVRRKSDGALKVVYRFELSKVV